MIPLIDNDADKNDDDDDDVVDDSDDIVDDNDCNDDNDDDNDDDDDDDDNDDHNADHNDDTNVETRHVKCDENAFGCQCDAKDRKKLLWANKCQIATTFCLLGPATICFLGKA